MRKFRILKLLIWIIIIYFIVSLFSGKKELAIFSFQKPSLSNDVESILKDTEGNYGIYIKNLSSGKTFALNEHREFDPASLYKMWVMGAVYEQIKEGKLKEDDTLVVDIEALNKKFDIDPEDAELKEGVIDFSIKSAIEQMITISHNYAALILLEKAGNDNINDFLKRYGLDDSSIGPVIKTTAKDISQFLEGIYKGEVVDAQYSQKMIDVLVKQQVNDRLPKYLPEGTKIAHKTGNLGFFENDAGIVYSPAGDYIIVVLTETNDPLVARDKIGRISEAFYGYINK